MGPEDTRRAGQVDHAQKPLIHRIVNRGGGAGPGLYALTEMFRRMYDRRPARADRGADAIRADCGLVPAPTPHQMDAARCLMRAKIADLFQHQSFGIGQDQKRVGFGQQRADLGKRALSGHPQVGVFPTGFFDKVFRLVKRGEFGRGIDARREAPRPGFQNFAPYARRLAAAEITECQEIFPGAHGCALVQPVVEHAGAGIETRSQIGHAILP